MGIAWAIGAGTGLSALAGFRAFLPLAVYMLMARMGWAWGFKVEDTPFNFLMSNVAIAILLVLVVVEVIITRITSLSAIERTLRLPLAAAAGALLFSASLSGEFPEWQHFLGIPAGLTAALLGFYVYRGLIHMGEGSDPGPALDISVIALSIITMLLPPAGYLLGIITVWLALRVRRLKKMKYKGLRVLA